MADSIHSLLVSQLQQADTKTPQASAASGDAFNAWIQSIQSTMAAADARRQEESRQEQARADARRQEEYRQDQVQQVKKRGSALAGEALDATVTTPVQAIGRDAMGALRAIFGSAPDNKAKVESFRASEDLATGATERESDVAEVQASGMADVVSALNGINASIQALQKSTTEPGAATAGFGSARSGAESELAEIVEGPNANLPELPKPEGPSPLLALPKPEETLPAVIEPEVVSTKENLPATVAEAEPALSASTALVPYGNNSNVLEGEVQGLPKAAAATGEAPFVEAEVVKSTSAAEAAPEVSSLASVASKGAASEATGSLMGGAGAAAAMGAVVIIADSVKAIATTFPVVKEIADAIKEMSVAIPTVILAGTLELVAGIERTVAAAFGGTDAVARQTYDIDKSAKQYSDSITANVEKAKADAAAKGDSFVGQSRPLASYAINKNAEAGYTTAAEEADIQAANNRETKKASAESRASSYRPAAVPSPQSGLSRAPVGTTVVQSTNPSVEGY